MITKGLLVKLEAKPGQDENVEAFLNSALPLLRDEPGTEAWFAVRFGRSEYGIVDVFPDEAARQAHLDGKIAAALMAVSGELLTRAPHIHHFDVFACKLPDLGAWQSSTKALLLTFKAKSQHEAEVRQFLKDAKPLVEAEPGTTAWFAIQLQEGPEGQPALYGIFDVFPDNSARFAHLVGHVPRELAKHSLSILGSVPDMDLLNVICERLPS